MNTESGQEIKTKRHKTRRVPGEVSKSEAYRKFICTDKDLLIIDKDKSVPPLITKKNRAETPIDFGFTNAGKCQKKSCRSPIDDSILSLLKDGKTPQEITDILFTSAHTIIRKEAVNSGRDVKFIDCEIENPAYTAFQRYVNRIIKQCH